MTKHVHEFITSDAEVTYCEGCLQTEDEASAYVKLEALQADLERLQAELDRFRSAPPKPSVTIPGTGETLPTLQALEAWLREVQVPAGLSFWKHRAADAVSLFRKALLDSTSTKRSDPLQHRNHRRI
jgi:hypothetical protein